MSNLPTRAAVVWPDTDKSTEAARAVVDYCQRAGLSIEVFASLPEGLALLDDGLVDAVVVATGKDLHACGIHVASAWTGRPMPVRPAPSRVPATQRRPRLRGGAR